MRFTAVRFTHPVDVFKGDRGSGFFCTYPNEITRPCDSIETCGQFLILTRTDMVDGAEVQQVKAVPLSKIESADPDLASLMGELGAEPQTEPVKRGPGRPRKEPEATA